MKNSLQVFFSVRIYACLLLMYTMMLGLVQRTKLPVHVQAKDIHRVRWLKPAITKKWKFFLSACTTQLLIKSIGRENGALPSSTPRYPAYVLVRIIAVL